MIERKRRISRALFNPNPNSRVVFVGNAVNITYYPNSEEKHCRFTVVVSKKISKLSTDRNRIKRIVYEVVRSGAEEFDNKFRGDMVFVLKKVTSAISYALIEKDIAKLLLKRKNEENPHHTD